MKASTKEPMIHRRLPDPEDDLRAELRPKNDSSHRSHLALPYRRVHDPLRRQHLVRRFKLACARLSTPYLPILPRPTPLGPTG